MPPQNLTEAFTKKKAAILTSLSQSLDTYTDKSPKGSVDAPIIDLIHEINSINGLVTTSSCSGRVAVFVEGPQSLEGKLGTDTDALSKKGLNVSTNDDFDDVNDLDQTIDVDTTKTSRSNKIKTGPGGKGGGRWLFVSHDPVSAEDNGSVRNNKTGGYFTKLCGLSQDVSIANHDGLPATPRRLIHLSFSPLILHILTADLSMYARPLLAAAINAGYRESGVQSLAALDMANSDTQAASANVGTMLAIRTAGLTFETVIGQVRNVRGDDGTEYETMQSLVSEDYLRMCFEVIDERFSWNEKRKERLRVEIKKAFTRLEVSRDLESKEERWKRKRAEGLRIKAEKEFTLKQMNIVDKPEQKESFDGSYIMDIEGIESLSGAFNVHTDF